MRIAIVHDWLTSMRGGEKVLSLLCGLMPQADLLTLIHTPGACDERIEGMNIRTSWLNRLPGAARYYRHRKFANAYRLSEPGSYSPNLSLPARNPVLPESSGLKSVLLPASDSFRS